jgi:hypothetical protein
MNRIILLLTIVTASTGFAASTTISSSTSNKFYANTNTNSAAFTNSFAPDDSIFQSALNGRSAYSVTSTPLAWNQNISGAQRISTASNAKDGNPPTALFAASFTLPSVSQASISINYWSDNTIGSVSDYSGTTDPNTLVSNGFFINGFNLSNSKLGDFKSIYSYTSDITQYLVTGTNTLFVNFFNQSGPGALQYKATITYTAGVNSNTVQPYTAVPEPSTYALFGIGALALVVAYRRKAA